MKAKFLIPILMVAIAITFACGGDDGDEPVAEKPYLAIEMELRDLINDNRKTLGMDTLTDHILLKSSAQNHSRDMALNIVTPLTHGDFEGRMQNIMNGLGISDYNTVTYSEMLAAGPKTAQEVFDVWKNKDSDRMKMQGDYNLIGVGIRQDASRVYFFTVIFMKAEINTAQ